MSHQRKNKTKQCDMLEADTDCLKKTSNICRLDKVHQDKKKLKIVYKKEKKLKIMAKNFIMGYEEVLPRLQCSFLKY